MIKLIILLIISFLLIGCCGESEYDYKCSEDQLKLVKIEKDICVDSQGYNSKSCFIQAKITHCRKRKRK